MKPTSQIPLVPRSVKCEVLFLLSLYVLMARCLGKGATSEDLSHSATRTLHMTICSWQKPQVFEQLLLLCHQITSELLRISAPSSSRPIYVLDVGPIQYCPYMMESMRRPQRDRFPSLLFFSQLFCHQSSAFALVLPFMLIYWFALQFLPHILLWIFRRPW
jgi:hypothetical protein